MSTTRRLAKNFSWLLAGNIISGGATFFLIVYLARVLSAAAFGLFNFAQAFLLYLLLLVDSGLSMLGMREISRDRAGAAQIAVNIFAVRGLLALVILALSTLVIYLVPLSLELRLLFIFTFLFVACRALNADWFFQGLEKMEWIAFSKVAFSVLTLALVIWLVKSPADLVKVPLLQFISGFLIFLALLLVILKRVAPASLSDLKPAIWWQYFLLAWPLGASLILIQINYNLDTIMLGFMDQPVVVGYYNAAYKIYYILLGLFVVWQGTALPTMNQKMKDSLPAAVNFSQKFVRLTLLIFVPLCFIVFLLAPLLIDLIFGAEYVAASLVLQFLIWTFIPTLIGSSYSVMWLISAGKFKEFSWSAAIGAAANICLNFLLIPGYSMYGAAVATFIAQVLSMFVSAYLAQKVHRLNLFKFLFWPLGLAAITWLLFLGFNLAAAALPLLTRIVLSSVAFLTVYTLLALIFERTFIFSFVKELLKRG